VDEELKGFVSFMFEDLNFLAFLLNSLRFDVEIAKTHP